MPITAGSYTFGATGGADYPTLGAIFAQMKGQTTTGDITITQISDSYESGAADCDAMTISSGHTVLIDNSTPHGGRLGVGNIIECDAASLYCRNVNGPGKLHVRNLQFKNTSESTYSRCLQVTGSLAFDLHDCIFDSNERDVAYGIAWLYVQRTSVSGECNVHNCLFTGYIGTGFGTNGLLYLQGNAASVIKISNITVDGLGGGPSAARIFGITNAASYVRNSVFMSNALPALSTTDASTNYSNIATNRTSAIGTGAIVDFVPADEFISLDRANENYLVPKLTSQFHEAGSAVSQTEDMAGVTYDAAPPIGAYVGLESGPDIVFEDVIAITDIRNPCNCGSKKIPVQRQDESTGDDDIQCSECGDTVTALGYQECIDAWNAVNTDRDWATIIAEQEA